MGPAKIVDPGASGRLFFLQNHEANQYWGVMAFYLFEN